jgi:hypothetical protein
MNTEMVMLLATTFQSPYYEHLIGSSTQHFNEVMRIAKIIEQAIKMGKIESSTMDSRTMRTNQSEDDFQLGNLSCVSGLVINYSNASVRDQHTPSTRGCLLISIRLQNSYSDSVKTHATTIS